ncbi:uncharacterized protein LOC131318726 [Rhododendron vialii]|uniref:uncharacterized protein LOC131318726 n=1 Tax=Rhododendron vialii TaxID=182163 RepID=UPI00265DAB95|nr:uncharacterized protein LOC131318726 [Rhododendron vialii]
MAQRARRERERNLKQGHSYPSGQRSQLSSRANQRMSSTDTTSKFSFFDTSRRPLNSFRQGSIATQSIEKRQRVAQTSTSQPLMPSTSSTTHANLPNITNRVKLCCEDELEVPMNFEGPSRAHIISGRHNLGNMDIQCLHCKALHWMNERLAKSSISHPLFGTCCFKGKIRLPTLITPPPPIRALYD